MLTLFFLKSTGPSHPRSQVSSFGTLPFQSNGCTAWYHKGAITRWVSASIPYIGFPNRIILHHWNDCHPLYRFYGGDIFHNYSTCCISYSFPFRETTPVCKFLWSYNITKIFQCVFILCLSFIPVSCLFPFHGNRQQWEEKDKENQVIETEQKKGSSFVECNGTGWDIKFSLFQLSSLYLLLG